MSKLPEASVIGRDGSSEPELGGRLVQLAAGRRKKAGLFEPAGGSCNGELAPPDTPGMDGALARREDCVERLAELTGESLFLSRYALLFAQELLTIDHLNDLVDVVEELSEVPEIRSLVRVETVLAERWKRSRLS